MKKLWIISILLISLIVIINLSIDLVLANIPRDNPTPNSIIPSISVPSATNNQQDWGGWDEFPPGSIPSVTNAPIKK